jgi:hypothetical protein
MTGKGFKRHLIGVHNRSMFLPFVCLASFLCSGQAPAQAPDTSSKGLLKDVDVLEKTYMALHPGLYRYNTRPEIDAAFAELRRKFGQDRTLPDSYLALSEFLATIKCGHTYANFFNQPDAVAKELLDKPNKVPFAFRWIKKTMVVTSDATTEHAFPRGTEILAINGTPTARVLAKLMGVARADGSNDAKRIADLEVLGTSKYEAFDVFFPLYFPSASSTYRFKVRRPGAKRIEMVEAAMISSSARQSGLPALDPMSPAWTLTYPKKDVALLEMPTWAMYNRKWDWKAFLQTSFDELAVKSIPNLVIDLRGNEGGDSVGDYILPRLVKEKVATENYQRYTRYRTVPQDLRPNLSTWDPSFYDWGKSAQPDLNGFFKLTRFDDLMGSIVAPGKTPYRGKVYLLVGPENSSATFEFACQVQRLKLGTLVGRPTGGSLRGINGGAFLFLTLPNSKIEVDVPLIAQFSADERPDRGLLPDILVQPIAADIAAGRDVEMSRVYELIGKG